METSWKRYVNLVILVSFWTKHSLGKITLSMWVAKSVVDLGSHLRYEHASHWKPLSKYTTHSCSGHLTICWCCLGWNIRRMLQRAPASIKSCSSNYTWNAFHLLNWLSLACKRKLHKCSLVFKCLNNLVPKYLTEYFIRNKAFHDYGTRRSNDLRPFHLLNWLSLACKRKLHKCNLVFKCLNNLVPKYLTEYFIRNKAFHDYGTRRSNDLRPFHLLNWLSLACKRKLHKCNLVFKCLNNLVPKYLTEYFIRNKAFHDYGTRRSNDLHPPKPMTNMGKRTFKYAGTIHSNFLPAHIKTALSFSNFKSLLIKHYS